MSTNASAHRALDGLFLLASLVSETEEGAPSALRMLCMSTEPSSRVDSAAPPSLTADEQAQRALNGGVSTEEAAAGIYNDDASVDVSEAGTPVRVREATVADDPEDDLMGASGAGADTADGEGIAAAAAEAQPMGRIVTSSTVHTTQTTTVVVASSSSGQAVAPVGHGRGGQLVRVRPGTAERIRVRTAKLMHELADLDRFRELRTISNNMPHASQYTGSAAPYGGNSGGGMRGRSTSKNGSGRAAAVRSSPQQSGSPTGFDKTGAALPPISPAGMGGSRGGLFSETLAQSRHSNLISPGSAHGASRLGTSAGASPVTSGAPRSQTRGDGRAGFSAKESTISGLVQELTNKWGR